MPADPSHAASRIQDRGNIDVTNNGRAQLLLDVDLDPSKQSPLLARLGERIKLGVPHAVTCAGFCGGRRCKYESGDSWSVQDQAIRGLFSNWYLQNNNYYIIRLAVSQRGTVVVCYIHLSDY